MKTKLFLLFLGILLLVVGLVAGCGQVAKQQDLPANTGANYSGLSITPDVSTLSVGSTQQFMVNGLIKSSSANNQTIIWTVSGGIGTIDASGLFTATAEGIGSAEVKAGELLGKAAITVVSGKVVSGSVKDIYANGVGIASAIVMAGGKIVTTGANGAYVLSGVSADANTISAAVPDMATTTLSLSGDKINIPMGIPLGGWYVSPQMEYTFLKGRIVDGNGSLISTIESYYCINFENNSGSGTLPSGTFLTNIAVPINRNTYTGEIVFVYKKGPNDYYGVFKEVTLTRGVTLDVGDITVKDPVAIITGKITDYNKYYNSVCTTYGVKTPAGRCSLGYVYSSYDNILGKIGGGTYTLRVPPISSGYNNYLSAYASDSDSLYLKYYDNINISSGTNYTYDFSFPPAIKINYPTEGQNIATTTPKFEWSSAGNDYLYLVFVGDKINIKWIGFTNGTSLEYPSFPAGSSGEYGNLQKGKEYFIRIVGNKIPNIDPKDIKYEDLMNAVEISQMNTQVFFTIDGPSTSGATIKDTKGKEEFDRKVNEYLEKMGIHSHAQ